MRNIALLLACLLLAACQETITFRVVNEAGEPVPQARIGATRMEAIGQLGNAEPGDEIPVEYALKADMYGRAVVDVPAGRSGLDQVVVWTAADGYLPTLHPGIALADWVPTMSEVRSARVQVLDLTKERDVELLLLAAAGEVFTKEVAMRDGARLATDVYLPRGEGPWPVLLARTPYNKDGWSAGYADMGLELGYAVVVQDMRGRFASEGGNLPFIAGGWGELQDGYDTCGWITRQEWCNGSIGTVGGSALGITQNLLAPTQPPGVRCQHIAVSTSSLFHQAAYQGGQVRLSQLEGWLGGQEFDPEAMELFYEHNTYDEFWQQLNIEERIEDIRLPAVHVGGWFDTFSQGTIDSYLLRQHYGGDSARRTQKLIMGPWTHGVGNTLVGGLEFPGNAAASPLEWQERWFAYWLRGVDNNIMQEPAVQYYTMGAVGEEDAPGNEWRTSDDWPPPATETEFLLSSDGKLTQGMDAQTGGLGFTFDPGEPVPTLGGRNLELQAGSFDQQSIEQRGDVLVFSTPVLAEPLEVTGRIRCRLLASSNAVDTDIAVRLCDVYPDGRSMLIADGILRLSRRNGMEKIDLLTPGEQYEVYVDLWSTSMVFNAGHSIRLSVAGSNYPRWQLNPGTGADWQDGDEYVEQTTTIECGPAASALILPLAR